jgi:hypothetical protein
MLEVVVTYMCSLYEVGDFCLSVSVSLCAYHSLAFYTEIQGGATFSSSDLTEEDLEASQMEASLI